MGAGPAVVSGERGAWVDLLDPNRKYHNNWRLICLNFWILLFLITSTTNGYDGSMMNGLQSLTQWEDDFNHPTGGMLGLLNAIQNIGSLGAYPFAPYLSDGIGRRPTIFFGALLMCAATAIQTASNSVRMFIGARFLIGFGLTFAANSAPMLVSEVAYPPHRAPATSMYNSLWYLGSIIAAWTTYGSFKIPTSWAWRLPSVLQGLPSVLQVCLIWFAPESPRWLVAKGRETQALKTLAYYHADGNELDPLVQYEFEEIRAAIGFERTVTKNVGYSSLFRKRGNLKRLRIIVAIAVFSQWSGNGLVSFYLNKVFDAIGITDPTVQLLINGILQIWNLAVALCASFLVDRVGRRKLFISSCAGMLVFFTLQTVCSALFAERGNPGSAHAVIAFIFLFYAAYDIAFTPLIVSYTVEILPYEIRAKGLTIFNLSVSVSLIFNQYVNPIALGKLAWKYYIVYCCWLAFELIFCYIYIVETKNLTLEETSALFDGEEALEKIEQQAAAQAANENDGDIREDDEKGSQSRSSSQHDANKV
ncbi:hexose transporter [Fomitiporia mediterranea MF3/22]|uniref:Hexose transporter n=1 Tax=Fomitiporia mediterranea (strain MF3/22) TaxID=694068 RepID=R7SJN0_FOMME|nr:hexose transporter [Fomitiporia mediterranea MF3/22]EJC97789.1 hexose transporter [Fomitiporia mediterranea MF3/22]